jgi:hypothetical protein
LREALHVTLPPYSEARIESADLTEVQPTEYRADLVVLLYENKPVLGIVVEVQLAEDTNKRYAWPAYAVGLRARIRCPVCVLVFTPRHELVRWASRPIDLGGGNIFTPLVIGPSGVPAVTDTARALADPELAVLSAMAHGGSDDTLLAAQIAQAAIAASIGLDPDRSVLYFDMVLASLSEAARNSLQAMDPANYEFQSEFAKRYLSRGRAEGEAKGRTEGEAKGRTEGEAKGRTEGEAKGRTEGEAKLLSKQLTLKFGPLDDATTQRLRAASTAEIELWAERILTADSLDDVFR